jgi:serine/threonine protein kinase
MTSKAKQSKNLSISNNRTHQETSQMPRSESKHTSRDTTIVGNKKFIWGNKITVYKDKLLGEGSFGKVYLGKLNESKDLVAVKTEEPRFNYLCKEGYICQKLTGCSNPPIGFSRFHWYGEDNEKNKYLVCEALGKSLQDLLIKCGNRFSLKTIIMIAFQILNRIQHLHENNYIHRDIKPSNFLIGIGDKKDTIYLVDFGLSKDFIDENGNHIEHTKNKSYVGTIRYMSVNCHKGTETSRRDDMASFIYMLFFFYFGQLPWQGLNDADKKKRLKAIQALKSQFNKDPHGFYDKKIPDCLLQILDYVRKLKFKQAVDYDRIRKFLYQGMVDNGYDYDRKWDWS